MSRYQWTYFLVQLIQKPGNGHLGYEYVVVCLKIMYCVFSHDICHLALERGTVRLSTLGRFCSPLYRFRFTFCVCLNSIIDYKMIPYEVKRISCLSYGRFAPADRKWWVALYWDQLSETDAAAVSQLHALQAKKDQV